MSLVAHRQARPESEKTVIERYLVKSPGEPYQPVIYAQMSINGMSDPFSRPVRERKTRKRVLFSLLTLLMTDSGRTCLGEPGRIFLRESETEGKYQVHQHSKVRFSVIRRSGNKR